MLSRKTLEIFGKCVTMCHAMRMIPYQWNAKLFRLEPSKSSLVLWYFNILNIFIYTFYLIFQISALNGIVTTAKASLIMGHFIFCMLTILACVLIATSVILKDELKVYVNHYIQAYLDFGEKYGDRQKKGKVPLTHADMFLKYAVRIVPCLGLSNILPLLKFYRFPLNYYSLLMPYIEKSYILILLISIYITWIMVNCCCAFTFFTCAVLPQGFAAIEIYAFLKVPKKIAGDKKVYPTPDAMPNIFRRMQIMANEFDVCISRYITPSVVTATMIMNILGCFSAITLPLAMHPIEKVLYTGFSLWITVFNMVVHMVSGTIFKNSTAMYRSWKIRQGNSPYFKKVIRSCRPQKVKVGPFYFIRKINALTSANRVINTTGKLLIWTGFGK